MGLVERQKPHSLEMADAYPLIEHILQEQKKSAAFEHWLQDSLSRATVRVSPLLRDELLKPPSARQAEERSADGPSPMGEISAGAEDDLDAEAAGADGPGAPQPPRRNGGRSERR